MKKFKYILLCLLTLTACQKDEEEPRIPQTADRTVMVYISGENNLSYFAQADINEMIEGYQSVSNSNTNLVLFVDRSNRYEKPFIARITKDKSNPVDTLYKYSADFSAADPALFKEVLGRIAETCPAKSYGLVLWGHANGWIIENQKKSAPRRAYGNDNGSDISGASLWLNIPDMRNAMEQLPFNWKFIFCDCCNMQNIEIAYEWKDVTEYIIASPAEITGVGAPYDVIVKDLFNTDDESMYKGICDDYYAQVTHEMHAGDEHMPISAVKTSAMEQLAAATRLVLPRVAEYTAQPGAMSGLIYYYNVYTEKPNKEDAMYDMNNVIQNALQDDPSAYQNWRRAFDQAVVYSKTSLYWHTNTVQLSRITETIDKQGVVSMFFPLEKYKNSYYHYNEAIKQMKWYQSVGWSEVGW